jgi:hypothetical protein
MTRIAALLLVLCAALALPAAAADLLYREDFGPARAPAEMFAGALVLGDDGPWHGEVGDEAYVLENRTDRNAVKYVYVASPEGGTMPQASIGLVVTASRTDGSSALGLLHGFDKATRDYVAFVVSDGGYSVLQRRRGKLLRLATGEIAGLVLAEPAHLVAVPDGSQLHFFVNRRRVVSVGASSVRTGEAAGVGLIAIGRGRFAFDDFTIAKE